jgi:hypothetical protein
MLIVAAFNIVVAVDVSFNRCSKSRARRDHYMTSPQSTCVGRGRCGRTLTIFSSDGCMGCAKLALRITPNLILAVVFATVL